MCSANHVKPCSYNPSTSTQNRSQLANKLCISTTFTQVAESLSKSFNLLIVSQSLSHVATTLLIATVDENLRHSHTGLDQHYTQASLNVYIHN